LWGCPEEAEEEAGEEARLRKNAGGRGRGQERNPSGFDSAIEASGKAEGFLS